MIRRAFLLLGTVLICAGAVAWFWLRPNPLPNQLRLTAIGFANLPGWQDTDPRKALSALQRTCDALKKKPPAQEMGGAGYAGTVGDWIAVCNRIPGSSARNFFEKNFIPFAISVSGKQDGLFTGYYEPELRVSRTKHGVFQTPIYGPPSDLISVDLGLFRDGLKGEHIAGRIADHHLVPYATRAVIDAHELPNAPVLFYAEDPIAAFFLHIQGSGRVSFDDGTKARVNYAAQNGSPYTAIGRTLILRGVLTKETVSMSAIRAWLNAHKQSAREVLETNPSYIFFALSPLGDSTLGSRGTEGVALATGASLAVDNRIHPLGVPLFVTTTVPDKTSEKPFYGLLIAQDTGGAIRGAVRGDIYWGVGADAERIAGAMKSKGQLYMLLPNKIAAKLAPKKDFKVRAP